MSWILPSAARFYDGWLMSQIMSLKLEVRPARMQVAKVMPSASNEILKR